jgi:hypothetical protein
MGVEYVAVTWSCVWAGVVYTVQWLAMGLTVRGPNTGVGDVVRTSPEQPCGSCSLRLGGDLFYFPTVKRTENELKDLPNVALVLKKE